MLGVNKINRDSEFRFVNKILLEYMCATELGPSPIFNDQVSHFLLFDYKNVSESSAFFDFIKGDDASGIFIGHLDAKYSREIVDAAAYISKEASELDISSLFNEQISENDGPIEVFVQRGFVVPAELGWAIWFSTYWEIAIAGFLSNDFASQFMRRHRDIIFLDNNSVLEHYKLNPNSMAPNYLAPNLLANAVMNSK